MINGRFTTISSHFLANSKLDWFKSYDQNANISIFVFLQYCKGLFANYVYNRRGVGRGQKKPKTCSLWTPPKKIVCVITVVPTIIQTCLAPQNDHLNLSLMKDFYIVGKKMTKSGCTTAIYQMQILVINLWGSQVS